MPGRHREDDENLVVGTLLANEGPHGWRGNAGNGPVEAGHIIAQEQDVSHALVANKHGYYNDATAETFVVAEPVTANEGWTPSNSEGQPHNVIAFDYRSSGTERSRPVRAGDYTGTLQAGREREAVAFKTSHYTRGKDGAPSDVTPALTTHRPSRQGDQDPVVQTTMGVRRLTPLECERLQGFPDNWTERTADGRQIPDSHRYRLMGNAVAAVCAQWLGHRLVVVDQLLRQEEDQ